MDRDLLEKLLTAQVLTLAEAMRAEKARLATPGTGISLPIDDAIQKIREQQKEIMQKTSGPTQ